MLAAFVLLVALAGGGCASFRSDGSGEEPRSSILNPRWNEDALREHLRFFRQTLRESPTEPSRAAAYLADQMKEAGLQPALEGRYRLQADPARAQGFVGYVAGKNPKYAREVVIVCADLTAEAPAVTAAALLEVARAYGTFAQYEPEPERSVLFALWFQPDSLASADSSEAGASAPAAGLRAYLHRPTWALSKTRSLLYLGLPVARRAATEALLHTYDLPLHRIAVPPGPPRAGAAAVQASPGRAYSAEDEDARRRAAVLRALALAQRTHERLRAATITSGEMMPALGDTLRVPHAQQ